MSPADLLPAQIADALKMLSERDGVSIMARCHHAKIHEVSYQVIECRRIPGDTIDHEVRSGSADTYDAALAACRAATFSGGQDK